MTRNAGLFVVKSRLKKINAIGHNAIHEPVFLRDAAAPEAGQLVPKRLRFSDSLKWVSDDCFDELENFQHTLPIVLHPPGKVFPKLRKEVNPWFSFLPLTGHDASLDWNLVEERLNASRRRQP